jgi:hypothetical protein
MLIPILEATRGSSNSFSISLPTCCSSINSLHGLTHQESNMTHKYNMFYNPSFVNDPLFPCRCLAKVSSEHGITTSKFLVQAVHPSLPKEQGSITIWKSFFHVKPNMLTVNLPVIHLPIPIASSEIILNSKKASWNRQLRGYQLDFGGRVITTSPKNFQLVECQSQLVNYNRL